MKLQGKKRWIVPGFITFGFVLILITLSWKYLLVYSEPHPINNIGWIGNYRLSIKESPWFQLHKYTDCRIDAYGFWISNGFAAFDCLIPDSLGGPAPKDLAINPEPANLYYKHFTPTDFIEILPTSIHETLLLKFQNNNPGESDLGITQFISQNATLFADKSFDSLIVGLEGGINGKVIRSVSLMVHPAFERPISNIIGIERRVKLLLAPFVEGAIGATVPTQDVVDLYESAMNYCGQMALDDNQQGYGMYKDWGDYRASVQWWVRGDGSGDCNIHVVRKS